MSTRVLLIDGGQSGCRARRPDGSELHGPGLPRRGRDYGGLRPLLDADVELVAAGLTGFDGDAAAVARALGVPVIVSNDAVTAHLGALGGEPGVVIVAGTGVIALAVAADGRWARADGYGALLGDDGGGYWIGRRGLAAALRARDGRPGGSSELLRRAEARFGERIVPAVYDAPDPVAAIAAFALDVADAARAGDDVAAAIWAKPPVSWPRRRAPPSARSPRPRARRPRPACPPRSRSPRRHLSRSPIPAASSPPAISCSRPCAPSSPATASTPRHPAGRCRAAARASGTVPRPDLRSRGSMTRLGHLSTEGARAERAEIDRLPTAELVRLMNDDDRAVPEAVAGAAGAIATAVDAIVERMAQGGRLIYAGAGTAGRIGVLDASECGPTFNTDRVLGVIAGGPGRGQHGVRERRGRRRGGRRRARRARADRGGRGRRHQRQRPHAVRARRDRVRAATWAR